MTITLAKYENIASAIVIMGSRFVEILEIKRCTEKKSMTVALASNAPKSPDLCRSMVERISATIAIVVEGMSAPTQRRCSFSTTRLLTSQIILFSPPNAYFVNRSALGEAR